MMVPMQCAVARGRGPLERHLTRGILPSRPSPAAPSASTTVCNRLKNASRIARIAPHRGPACSTSGGRTARQDSRVRESRTRATRTRATRERRRRRRRSSSGSRSRLRCNHRVGGAFKARWWKMFINMPMSMFMVSTLMRFTWTAVSSRTRPVPLLGLPPRPRGSSSCREFGVFAGCGSKEVQLPERGRPRRPSACCCSG
jgi:hypothetical protein